MTTRIDISGPFTDAGNDIGRVRIHHSASGLQHWAKGLCEALVKSLKKSDDATLLCEAGAEQIEDLLQGARAYRRDYVDASPKRTWREAAELVKADLSSRSVEWPTYGQTCHWSDGRFRLRKPTLVKLPLRLRPFPRRNPIGVSVLLQNRRRR